MVTIVASSARYVLVVTERRLLVAMMSALTSLVAAQSARARSSCEECPVIMHMRMTVAHICVGAARSDSTLVPVMGMMLMMVHHMVKHALKLFVFVKLLKVS